MKNMCWVFSVAAIFRRYTNEGISVNFIKHLEAVSFDVWLKIKRHKLTEPK